MRGCSGTSRWICVRASRAEEGRGDTGMMTIQPNAEAIPFGITVLIAAGLAVLAWRRGRRGGGVLAASFAMMMAGEAAWALFEGLELVIPDLRIKRFCFALRVAGASTTLLGMLFVVLGYTGRERWLTRRRLAAVVAPMAGADPAGLDQPAAPRLLAVDPERDGSAASRSRCRTVRSGVPGASDLRLCD